MCDIIKISYKKRVKFIFSISNLDRKIQKNVNQLHQVVYVIEG